MTPNTRHIRFRIYAVLGLAFCISFPAAAHHILGVPHYAYDEQYPQTPVLTYKAEVHDYEIEMTAFPGKPEPGERTSIHVYIRNVETDEVHDDTTTLTITRDRLLLAEPVVYGPVEAQLEESMYKFFPNFERDGNYSLALAFEGHGEHWVIQLPMVVGEPSSPWMSIGIGTIVLAALLLIARALQIKMKRRAAASVKPALASANTGSEEMA